MRREHDSTLRICCKAFTVLERGRSCNAVCISVSGVKLAYAVAIFKRERNEAYKKQHRLKWPVKCYIIK